MRLKRFMIKMAGYLIGYFFVLTLIIIVASIEFCFGDISKVGIPVSPFNHCVLFKKPYITTFSGLSVDIIKGSLVDFSSLSSTKLSSGSFNFIDVIEQFREPVELSTNNSNWTLSPKKYGGNLMDSPIAMKQLWTFNILSLARLGKNISNPMITDAIAATDPTIVQNSESVSEIPVINISYKTAFYLEAFMIYLVCIIFWSLILFNSYLCKRYNSDHNRMVNLS